MITMEMIKKLVEFMREHPEDFYIVIDGMTGTKHIKYKKSKEHEED